VEARAVLHAATSDDPAHADDPDAAGLSAIASWLVARAGGAYPPPPDVVPAALGDTDEAQFWRALLNGGQKEPAAPAASLAITWPILQQYPAALRRRIAPAVGEILSRGRQDKALAAFLAAFPDPSLDLTRAELLQRQGKVNDALVWLDAVGKRPNRLMRASAERAAVELRLSTGKMDAEAAAAALGRQIYAWRGGPGDLAFRMRVAALRAQAGHWRQALDLLRETDGLFPDAHAQTHAAETQLVSALLGGDKASRLSALDLVALAEEAGPLLSAADADVTLAPVLVDKLLALDLPARAETILQRLYDHAASPVQKAELGVRLAGLLADRGDAKGALGILDQADDSALDSRLVTQRGLLRARLLAESGRQTDALGILSAMQGDAAILLQAHILEDRHDWAAAGKLLETLVGTPSFTGKPDQIQRDMILRLANDESEAGDMTALRRLRSAQGARFASGPGAELFAVLTQEPIQAVDDLPRSGRELQAVRALPASLATH
jgi:tetratricopeptide (TPR) repeat protein